MPESQIRHDHIVVSWDEELGDLAWEDDGSKLEEGERGYVAREKYSAVLKQNEKLRAKIESDRRRAESIRDWFERGDVRMDALGVIRLMSSRQEMLDFFEGVDSSDAYRTENQQMRDRLSYIARRCGDIKRDALTRIDRSTHDSDYERGVHRGMEYCEDFLSEEIKHEVTGQ